MDVRRLRHGRKSMSETQVTLFVGLIGAGSALVGAILGAAVSYAIARQQFRATVLSGNRQAWINTVRDTVAEIQALALTVLGLYSAGRDLMETTARGERLFYLQCKLELLLNPGEQDHRDLVECTTRYILKVLEPIMPEDRLLPGTADRLRDIDPHTEGQTMTELAQRILKQEWQRVKKGK